MKYERARDALSVAFLIVCMKADQALQREAAFWKLRFDCLEVTRDLTRRKVDRVISNPDRLLNFFRERLVAMTTVQAAEGNRVLMDLMANDPDGAQELVKRCGFEATAVPALSTVLRGTTLSH
ncbi:hypothetical protein [Burkholderia gladioli]|uniref:hypothetical protein n=1 Tax=Burkholderia gladioli TaxID=28095 RepID=UPI00163FC36A|nr:hypothetical protein [Burkholderia gladioli]